MNSLSPALIEAYGSKPPEMIHETEMSMKRFAGYNPSYCYKDRDLETHLAIFDLELDDFSDGDRLLVVGSGTTRRFERELNQARPGISVISVDPLLSHGVSERQRESIRMGSLTGRCYEHGINFPGELKNGQAYFRAGAVCGGIALASVDRTKSNYLPFKENSFQRVLGLHSLPQYCAAEHVPSIMKDVLRVMSEGATAQFFPIFPEDEEAILTSDLAEHTTSLVIDGEDIHKWHFDSNPGVKRLNFVK